MVNAPAFLRYGLWSALLYAYNSGGEEAVRDFYEHYRPFVAEAEVPFARERHLVISALPLMQGQEPPFWFPADQRSAWETFAQAATVAHRRFTQARTQHLGYPAARYVDFMFSYHPLSSGNGVHALPDELNLLLLEDPHEDAHITILIRSLVLAMRWHITHGGLCLHSAAVARESDGFLFLGQSEAGKTTVAQFSAASGYVALGDDLNFVIPDSEDGYLLAAAPSARLFPAGYAMRRPPLRGIFTLAQDVDDYLAPLSPVETSQALFESFLQIPKAYQLPAEMTRQAFQIISAIARTVPGYELHFRKSPDFWQVIDAQFGR